MALILRGRVVKRIENPCIGGSIQPQATKTVMPTVLSGHLRFCATPNGAEFRPVLRVPPVSVKSLVFARFDSLLFRDRRSLRTRRGERCKTSPGAGQQTLGTKHQLRAGQ